MLSQAFHSLFCIMLSVVFALNTVFPFEEYLNVLNGVPAMTWTPGVPARMKGKTVEELKAMLMHVEKYPLSVERVRYVGAPPAAWDWTTQNAACVNYIRDQGNCGSCWAFSAVGAFNDLRCINKKDATHILHSEQYVVSCDPIDQGCNGGYLNMVWYFLEKTGTTTDACVPYTSGTSGVTGTCATKCTNGSAITLTKAAGTATNVCSSVTSIQTDLVTGPLTTGFTVYYDFELYTGGIYQHVWGPEMGGHAVEFVGYGTANNTAFWKVKNSWGASWGEQGYFRILKGVDECGIEDECYLGSV